MRGGNQTLVCSRTEHGQNVRLSQYLKIALPRKVRYSLSLSMEYQQKQSSTQLTFYTTCLDDMIAEENSVRTIDRFVDGDLLPYLGTGHN